MVTKVNKVILPNCVPDITIRVANNGFVVGPLTKADTAQVITKLNVFNTFEDMADFLRDLYYGSISNE